MRLAFLTGALSAAVAAAALASLVIWIVTVLTGSAAAWGLAAPVLVLAALIVGAGTYLAERVAYRRTLARRRATGEPWAFRER